MESAHEHSSTLYVLILLPKLLMNAIRKSATYVVSPVKERSVRQTYFVRSTSGSDILYQTTFN